MAYCAAPPALKKPFVAQWGGALLIAGRSGAGAMGAREPDTIVYDRERLIAQHDNYEPDRTCHARLRRLSARASVHAHKAREQEAEGPYDDHTVTIR